MCIASSCAHNSSNDPSNFEQFLSLWSGVYENTQQVEDFVPQPIDHQRLFVARVELPEFGEHVFYLEWQNLPAESVRRQRIYAFTKFEDEIELALHIFPNDEEFKSKTSGAHIDPTKLAGVSPRDMFPLPGCDIYMRQTQDGFSGQMRQGQCALPTTQDGRALYSWTKMRLSSTQFEYLDGWYFADDDQLARRFSPDWYKFNKLPD